MNPGSLVRSCPSGVSFSEWVSAPMPTSVCTALSTACEGERERVRLREGERERGRE